VTVEGGFYSNILTGEVMVQSFTRPYLADFLLSAQEVRWRTHELFQLIGSGKLEVTIDREFSLAKATEATAGWKRVKRGAKVLLREH
jgi:NADPH2:quinone reductase